MRALITLFACLSLTCTSCSDDSTPKDIDDVRESAGEPPASGAATTAERFGTAPAAEALADGVAGESQGIRWRAPKSWPRTGERPMRVVSFQPEGAPSTDCYITVLGGDGGGLTANVQRWRAQMGLPAMSADEIAGLPRREVLGRDAQVVEIDGSFRGMSGETIAEATMLGIIANLESRVLFVKMTGPTGEVAAERERFFAFCDSLE